MNNGVKTPAFAELLKRYDVQVPRYTSYPTVPSWSKTPTTEEWIADIRKTMALPSKSWSLYLHLPFCETLCTFCGCNNIITKDHKHEGDYIDLILKEWSLYRDQVPELTQRPLKLLHLGGGTPTFMAPQQLERLVTGLWKDISPDSNDFEASIEVDPRRTTLEHLKVLRSVGFNRISMGVQDFNESVQRLINRVQPFSVTEKLTLEARKLGYESVNFDLIYGLPAQTAEMMKLTLEQTLRLRPDRIAFYSFALVPWIKPAQRLFKDSDLPPADEKRELYEMAREQFLKNGYEEVGMDHFALPSDELLKARQKGELHRNFMGYTDKKTDLLLGLGISSISESATVFHQNEKLLPKYQESVAKNVIPTTRGHILSVRDCEQRAKILQLMTQYQLPLEDLDSEPELRSRLQEFFDFQMLEWKQGTLRVLEAGKPFLRNICSAFDDYLPRNPQPGQKLYSKSI